MTTQGGRVTPCGSCDHTGRSCDRPMGHVTPLNSGTKKNTQAEPAWRGTDFVGAEDPWRRGTTLAGTPAHEPAVPTYARTVMPHTAVVAQRTPQGHGRPPFVTAGVPRRSRRSRRAPRKLAIPPTFARARTVCCSSASARVTQRATAPTEPHGRKSLLPDAPLCALDVALRC